MKMSLCNTFRFFAVSTTIVLSIVGSPVPGLVIRHKKLAGRDANQDLMHQGSITVELKNEFKRPNDINSLKLINTKDDPSSVLLDSGSSKKNVSKSTHLTAIDVAGVHNDNKNKEKSIPVPLKLMNKVTGPNKNQFNVTSISQPTVVSNQYKGEYEGENSTTNIDISQTKEMNIVKNETSLSQANINNTAMNESQNNFNTQDESPSESTTFATEKEPNNKYSTKISASGEITTNINTNVSEKLTDSMEMSSLTSSVTAPSGKKYTVIERKRLSTTTTEPITSTDMSFDDKEKMDSTMYAELTTVTDKTEVMLKSESAQSRISLQDTMTSNIPSLEKLKTDLLSYPKFTSKTVADITTTSVPDDSITKVDTTTLTSSTFQSNPETPNTVSSKRAGYLDLSAKVTSMTPDDLRGLKLQGTEALQGPFDAETPDAQDETPEDKIVSKMESQGQLAEDAIKEELLKEETLNDNEENAKRYRDEQQQTQTDTPTVLAKVPANETQLNATDVQLPNTAPDDNLSVKPINLDKLKNTVLYPVNPNYKPLKKIEVQPAKPFVRDPDDNSWRNESLSSLGIVFKPKNSSKPFTQVLKNKTETEWNNLSEKERKSEVPDLRVRLEQIAQKRKSKKKKIDSYGNVYYTDYEENSSSEENTRAQHVEDTSTATIPTTDTPITTDITIVTPVPTTTLSTLLTTLLEVKNTSTFTTTSTPTQNAETTPASKKEPNKLNNVKTTKMFNIFDYYEASDDDDIADYLNMAKIDLKKFTVPIQTTFTTLTSPPLPILYTTPLTHYTSERKGTIQYFPPRTTKRPRKFKYNNSLRHKISSAPLTESPKNVLPMSFNKMPTTPYDNGMYYTSSPDLSRQKDQPIPPKNFDTDLYLTTPPLTTTPDDGFGVISNDGYDRANYVMKQYKDYMNEATQGSDHDPDKNGFIGYTQPPQVTVGEFMKDTTMKDHPKINEEYDYDTQFRKEVLDRFVSNFNENTKRFKSDFPLLYNNSIVHSGVNYNDKDVALSRAYFRRPYSNQDQPINVHDPYDPNCDNVTVELSPAYELHYYVPDQEEKQEVESKPINLPIRYRV